MQWWFVTLWICISIIWICISIQHKEHITIFALVLR